MISEIRKIIKTHLNIRPKVFVFCFVVEKLKPSLVLLLSFSSLRDSDRVQCSQAEIINREIELRS